LADVVEKVKSGVFRIVARTCDGASVGSGILVGPRLVATVEHVVAGAREIVLKRGGRKLGTAQVIGLDVPRDLALLRTSEPVDGHVFLLSRESPRLGEEVAVLGFPLGLPLTVTRGSVSGLNRTIPIDDVKRRRLVQTDAGVNAGNSGGPLLSIESGEVIGLVDLGSTQVNDIAFAVSARVAAPLLEAWRAAPQPVVAVSCGDGGAGSGTSGTSAGRAENVAYVDAIDAALIDSATTRADLGTLIEEVNSFSIPYEEAVAAIGGIVEQRRSLLSAVSSVDTPAAFSLSATLLRRSLVASIDDDLAIANWIDAMYAGDTAAADYYWQRQLELSAEASAAKTEFLSEYNAQRKRLLGRPPLNVRY
jgi:hypothetical protein